MSAQHCSGYETILFATDNLTIGITSSNDTVAHAFIRVLHSQDDTLSNDDSHDHLCEIIHCTSIRPDMLSAPLMSGRVIFVDGSCSKPQNGLFLAGYVVAELPDRCIEAFALLFKSAQAAELFVLTRACILSTNENVTLYTDSRYVFGVAHDFGRIWSTCVFIAKLRLIRMTLRLKQGVTLADRLAKSANRRILCRVLFFPE